MTEESTIVKTITDLLKLLVEHPNQLKVQVVPGVGQALILRVNCAKEDPGRLIGRQGRTSRSLRVILNAISLQHEQRLTLDIVSERAPGSSSEAANN